MLQNWIRSQSWPSSGREIHPASTLRGNPFLRILSDATGLGITRKTSRPTLRRASVINSVDKNAKDADVKSLRDSRFDTWLNYAINNSLVESYVKEGKNSLLPAGRKLLNDFRDIFDDLQFVWGTRDRSEGLMEEKDTEEVKQQGEEEAKARVNKVKAREDANQEPANSSQTSLVGCDLLSQGLPKAALGLAPDEERLAGVDEARHGDKLISKEKQEAEKAKAEEKKTKAKGDRRPRQAQLRQLLAWHNGYRGRYITRDGVGTGGNCKEAHVREDEGYHVSLPVFLKKDRFGYLRKGSFNLADLMASPTCVYFPIFVPPILPTNNSTPAPTIPEGSNIRPTNDRPDAPILLSPHSPSPCPLLSGRYTLGDWSMSNANQVLGRIYLRGELEGLGGMGIETGRQHYCNLVQLFPAGLPYPHPFFAAMEEGGWVDGGRSMSSASNVKIKSSSALTTPVSIIVPRPLPTTVSIPIVDNSMMAGLGEVEVGGRDLKKVNEDEDDDEDDLLVSKYHLSFVGNTEKTSTMGE
ncbi:hypothetical protein K435DRAFT_789106 [Dendrothele bispora CBS 962.96]|uniref:Uncharacterized protein n=1 Tax=Dendrothele bispora (strain CBS 962.96) TaxID=1314807 RepID=A0A4S8MX16_DENBC|nr:hypothetical protein K435DRAFT_789106 [Dendrothele bispora CBS 962.96]